MSNFDVQYNFIAIDRFSKVAKKVQDHMSKIRKLSGTSSKAFANQTASLAKTSTHIEKSSASLDKLGKVTTKVAKTTTLSMKQIKAGIKEGDNAFVRMTKHVTAFGDKMSYAGYMQFMNVAMPMMLVGKLGWDYTTQVQAGKVSFDDMFSKQKGFHSVSKQINVQADKFSKTSRFSKEEIVATSQAMASLTGNMQLGRGMTQAIMELNISEGAKTPLIQTAAEMKALIEKGGMFAGTMLPTGVGYNANRLREQIILQRAAAHKGILKADVGTAPAQLHKMMTHLSKISGNLLIGAVPGLEAMGKALEWVSHLLSGFMKKHKTLTSIFVVGALSAAAFTMVLTLGGAVIMAVSYGMEGLVKAVTLVKWAYRAAGMAAKFFSLSNDNAAASAVVDAGIEDVAAGGIIRSGGRFRRSRMVVGRLERSGVGKVLGRSMLGRIALAGGKIVLAIVAAVVDAIPLAIAAAVAAIGYGAYRYIEDHPKLKKDMDKADQYLSTKAGQAEKFGKRVWAFGKSPTPTVGTIEHKTGSILSRLMHGASSDIGAIGSDVEGFAKKAWDETGAPPKLHVHVTVDQGAKVTGVHTSSPSISLGTSMEHFFRGLV